MTMQHSAKMASWQDGRCFKNQRKRARIDYETRMASTDKKYPPSHAARAKRLEAAFDAYLSGLELLKTERKALIEKFLKRVESEKIDEIKKRIEKL
jgi:hypothetical protein